MHDNLKTSIAIHPLHFSILLISLTSMEGIGGPADFLYMIVIAILAEIDCTVAYVGTCNHIPTGHC